MTHKELEQKGAGTAQILQLIKTVILITYKLTCNMDALDKVKSLALYDSLKALDEAINRASEIGRY